MKIFMKTIIKDMLRITAVVLMAISPSLSHAANSLPAVERTQLVNTIVRTDVWQEYQTFEGIKIEYRFQDCDSEGVGSFRNQTLVFFRFTNTTNENLTLSWQVETYRNNVCENCARIGNGEHSFSVKLEPNQVIEGDCSSFDQREMYVFSNFINQINGMSDEVMVAITDFKFINLQTAVWK
jgi:hypothetical protein